ncbi:mitochondrial carrier domain-containing protein [Syncephalis fuscata]|nr:mitochondrial carrier domain-containing protein [Syncephalis fuscata]
MATTATQTTFDVSQTELLTSEPPFIAPSTNKATTTMKAHGASTQSISMTSKESWLQKQIKTNERLRHSIAGAGAGCSAAIITCPLDVVKTRLQNQGPVGPGMRPYRGTFGTLYRIWMEESVRGLYRGLGPTILGYLPTWAIYFSMYDQAKVYLAEKTGRGNMHWSVHIGAAITAGISCNFATNPLWVIKTRMMTQSAYTDYRYNSTPHAFHTIWRQEGIRGFYKGLGTSLFGISHVAVQFPLYERLKLWLRKYHDTIKHRSIHILLASGLSKMAASVITYPHEVVRTRLQNQSRPPFKYKGIFNAIRTIYIEEGWTAFYKGMPTNLLRTVPTSAITFLTYELLIRRLNTFSEE